MTQKSRLALDSMDNSVHDSRYIHPASWPLSGNAVHEKYDREQA